MTLEEYRKQVLKVSGSRVHKLVSHYNIKDIYAWCCKEGLLKYNNRNLKEGDFYKIIREVTKKQVYYFLKGNSIKFPLSMGGLILAKRKLAPKIKDGKLKIYNPVDWDATLKLWHSHAKYEANKTLIRVPTQYTYHTIYDKKKKNCRNLSLYHFKINRKIKLSLKELITNNEIDAYESI